jgi:hypothetical protein
MKHPKQTCLQWKCPIDETKQKSAFRHKAILMSPLRHKAKLMTVPVYTLLEVNYCWLHKYLLQCCSFISNFSCLSTVRNYCSRHELITRLYYPCSNVVISSVTVPSNTLEITVENMRHLFQLCCRFISNCSWDYISLKITVDNMTQAATVLKYCHERLFLLISKCYIDTMIR